MEHKILVLGGGYAGLLAAIRLAGKAKAAKPHITLVNASDTFVERIRLHQQAAGQTLKQHHLTKILRGTGVQFIQGWVTQIDPAGHKVEVKTESGMETLTYNTLVYALGSHIDRDRVPGVRENAYVLDAHSKTLKKSLPELAQTGSRVVLVGGGLTGIETVTELAEAYPGLQVTMISREGAGALLSVKGREHLRKVFDTLGITVEKGGVSRIDPGAVVMQNGQSLPFDLCLWAGAFALSRLAQEAGFKVNESGQILVDANLRSVSHSDVYVAGDAAGMTDPQLMSIRMSCAAGMPMGAHVADNIAAQMKNQPQKPFRFGYAVQCISLGRHNGLVQRVNADDTMREQIFTNNLAVFIKEGICKFTVWALYFERHFPGAYLWIKPRREEINNENLEPQRHKEHKGFSVGV